MPETEHRAPSFDEHCQEAVHSLRAALLDLYRAVGADPAAPREVSRQFKLHKNLTWRVSKIMGAEDAFDAVPHIPGAGGLRILLRGMRDAGAPPEVIERVNHASAAFDRMVEIHTGDRASLDVILDNMGAGRNRLELSRRLAFEGGSGLWGIRARAQVIVHFMAPNARDPSLLDLAVVNGIVDLRRLRWGLRWPLNRHHAYDDHGDPIATSRAPIDGGRPHADGPFLLKDFCSRPTPRVEERQARTDVIYELCEGPVGKTGEVTCYSGYLSRGDVSRYAQGEDAFSQNTALVGTPVETLLFDIILHRDLAETFEPEVIVYGNPAEKLGPAMCVDEANRLPIQETLRSLGGGPARVATPLVERHQEMVDWVFERVGWNPADFVGRRLVLRHPPMPSGVVVRSPLPARHENGEARRGAKRGG